MKWIKIVSIYLSFSLGVGCGYHFRTSESMSGRLKSIKKLYVHHFKNTGFGTSVEMSLTNELIRELNATGVWEIVGNISDADGEVHGDLVNSNTIISSETTANTLPSCQSNKTDDFECPDEQIAGGPEVRVVSHYRTELQCTVTVSRKEIDQRSGLTKWTRVFSYHGNSADGFVASNRLGKGGSTNSLINRSRSFFSQEKMIHQVMAQAVSAMLEGF